MKCFQEKTQVNTKHLCLLVYVLLYCCIAVAYIDWSVRWKEGLVGWRVVGWVGWCLSFRSWVSALVPVEG